MNILVASSMDPAALEALRSDHDVIYMITPSEGELRALIADREIVVFRSGVDMTCETMDRAPNLRLLIRAGSGIDNVDVKYARQRGIRLFRIAGPSAQAVAELTFGLMLAVARNIVVGDRLLREGRWAKHELAGNLLAGKTVGIVGAGNIGSRVGELAVAWGMRALGCVETPSPAVRDVLAAKRIELVTFDECVAEADFLTLHVPLTARTLHMIDAEVLSRMKPGSFLVNAARGGVVDEDALLRVLTEGGPLRGAAMDVHEQEGEGRISPLASLPNVVLTPHIGAMAAESQAAIGRTVLDLVDSFVAGRLDTGTHDDPVLA